MIIKSPFGGIVRSNGDLTLGPHSGCHIGDCHYINANQWTVKRIEKIRRKMEKLAIRQERLQLEWVSAAEAILFARSPYTISDPHQNVAVTFMPP